MNTTHLVLCLLIVAGIGQTASADNPLAAFNGRGGGTIISMTNEFAADARRITGAGGPALPLLPMTPMQPPSPQEQFAAIRSEMQRGQIVIAGLNQHMQFLRQQLAFAQQANEPALIILAKSSLQECAANLQSCHADMAFLQRRAKAITNGQ